MAKRKLPIKKKIPSKSKMLDKVVNKLVGDDANVSDDDELPKSSFQMQESEDSADSETELNRHNKLLAAIRQPKSKTRKKIETLQRSEISANASEFNITETEQEKLKLDDLLGSLKKNSKNVTLTKKLKKVQGKEKKLQPPLPKPQAEKLQRELGYSKSVKEVSKWENVVDFYRNADQITFPLKQPSLSLVKASDYVRKFQSKVPLEEEIDKLLNSNKNFLKPEKELTEAEEEMLKAMSVEEAESRHRELLKMRALLSYKEKKARYQNKIKSKRYRRILKHERLKNQMKEFEKLKATDPELAEEKLQETEKLRALERVTLRHRSTGKWAKAQMLRAKYDLNSKKALAEQHQLGQQLKKKTEIFSNDNSQVEEPMEINIENDMPLKLDSQSSYNPWLCSDKVTNIVESLNDEKSSGLEEGKEQTESTEAAVDILDAELPEGLAKSSSMEASKEKKQVTMKRKFQKPNVENKLASNYFESEELSDNTLVQSQKRIRTLEDIGELDNDEENSVVEKDTKKLPNEETSEEFKKPEIDPTKFISLEPKHLKSQFPDIISEQEDQDDEQKMTIAEAFADDNVVKEFRAEKMKNIKDNEPAEIDLFVPGWGSWAGAGIKISKRKRKKFVVKATPAPPRKDSKMGHVIINEKADSKIAAYQISDLPFPFTNVAEFEKTVKHPVGNTWNPEKAFQELIAPEIITQKGKIIEPLDEDALTIVKKRKFFPKNKNLRNKK